MSAILTRNICFYCISVKNQLGRFSFLTLPRKERGRRAESKSKSEPSWVRKMCIRRQGAAQESNIVAGRDSSCWGEGGRLEWDRPQFLNSRSLFFLIKSDTLTRSKLHTQTHIHTVSRWATDDFSCCPFPYTTYRCTWNTQPITAPQTILSFWDDAKSLH